jgi:hypothetical protein
MSDWLKIFSDNKYHSLISNCALLIVERVFREGRDCGLISTLAYDEIYNEISFLVHKDLTTAIKSFYIKKPMQVAIGNWSDVNALSLPRSIEIFLREQKRPVEPIELVKSLGWRIREAEPLFKLLQTARNASLHDFRERNQLGWELVVPASVIRVLEICPIPKNSQIVVEELSAFCVNQIKMRSSSNEFEPVEVEQNFPNSVGEELSKKIDRIEEMLLHQKNNPIHPNANVSVKNDSGENSEPEAQAPQIDWITPQVLKRELLGLKKQSEELFSDVRDFGPAYNFFQNAIIMDIIEHRPKDAAEVLRLPDVGWRHKEKPDVLGKQFKYFRTSIDQLLKRVDWD